MVVGKNSGSQVLIINLIIINQQIMERWKFYSPALTLVPFKVKGDANDGLL
jgi:hypothetical protein